MESLTTQLARDLRTIPEISVRPATGRPEPGSKSVSVGQIGSLVLSAAGLGALRDIIVAYLGRSSARSITVRNGDRKVIITVASKDDVAAVSRQLGTLLSEPGGTEGDA